MKKLMVMIAALAMISSSAYAADWNFYGSARVSTFYTDVDAAGSANDTNNIGMALQSNARIGANVKASDELAGRFEYGASGGVANIRYLYGVWNFGAGSLLVGQDDTPVWHGLSNQIYATDNGLAGWGENGSPRTAQLKLIFGGFEVALLAPSLNYETAGAEVTGTSATTEVKLPAIQAKYTMAMDNWFAAVSGAYQTFDIGLTNSKSVDSYMVAASAGITLDALSLKAGAFMGTNVGNIAATDTVKLSGTSSALGAGYANYTAGVLTDNDAYGYEFVAAYTFNDMFALEAGVGYAKTELDNSSTDNDVTSYYVQVPVTLAPGVFVIPEIGKIDYKQTTQDEITYYGAKWQINF